MPPPDPLQDLELLIRSRYGLIFLETVEEDRAGTLLRLLADRLRLPLFTWSRTRGLRRDGVEGSVYGTADPGQALAHVEVSHYPALYLFAGLAEDLEDRGMAARLKDAAAQFAKGAGAIVMTGAVAGIPESLRPVCATFRLPSPRLNEYRDLLQQILRDLTARMPVRVEMKASDFAKLLHNLQGLTLTEAEKVLTRVIVEDGKLTPDDIRAVAEAKKTIVEREGVLEYTPVEQSLADIADLAGLKQWLSERRAILSDPSRAKQFGVPFPKGVLLLGVPGCGKSLCARAVAMEWGLPLLKLDPSSLYNKYIGESEKNFRRAMATAERLAPVILWIDELEKAFSSAAGDEDGGVSKRIFGTFLSWLQDRKGDVFVVATANDVALLPPEFLRKGRFDEIFFVDLPTEEARRDLFRLHLTKRGKDPAGFALAELAKATEGFSGSEVEQGIVAALTTAFSSGTDLTQDLLRVEIRRTRPLSETMAEKVEALREWARERARSAQ
jgi:SpoVK/Ycf46/Vps4 family AAA+-type ATPase